MLKRSIVIPAASSSLFLHLLTSSHPPLPSFMTPNILVNLHAVPLNTQLATVGPSSNKIRLLYGDRFRFNSGRLAKCTTLHGRLPTKETIYHRRTENMKHVEYQRRQPRMGCVSCCRTSTPYSYVDLYRSENFESVPARTSSLDSCWQESSYGIIYDAILMPRGAHGHSVIFRMFDLIYSQSES